MNENTSRLPREFCRNGGHRLSPTNVRLRTRGDGTVGRECRACANARKRAQPPSVKRAERSRNRDAYRERDRARYAADRDRFVSEQRARRYSLPVGLTEWLYEDQRGRCSICRTARPLGGDNGLVMDHDHKTGKARGLLCRSCNLHLPVVERHGLSWAQAAANYLAFPELQEGPR